MKRPAQLIFLIASLFSLTPLALGATAAYTVIENQVTLSYEVDNKSYTSSDTILVTVDLVKCAPQISTNHSTIELSNPQIDPIYIPVTTTSCANGLDDYLFDFSLHQPNPVLKSLEFEQSNNPLGASVIAQFISLTDQTLRIGVSKDLEADQSANGLQINDQVVINQRTFLIEDVILQSDDSYELQLLANDNQSIDPALVAIGTPVYEVQQSYLTLMFNHIDDQDSTFTEQLIIDVPYSQGQLIISLTQAKIGIEKFARNLSVPNDETVEPAIITIIENTAIRLIKPSDETPQPKGSDQLFYDRIDADTGESINYLLVLTVSGGTTLTNNVLTETIDENQTLIQNQIAWWFNGESQANDIDVTNNNEFAITLSPTLKKDDQIVVQYQTVVNQ